MDVNWRCARLGRRVRPGYRSGWPWGLRSSPLGRGRICWVQEQVRQRENSGCEGLDELEAAQAHRLAGDRDEKDEI
jgi:hypothetical protein